MRILIGLIIVVTLALVVSGRQWWSLRRTPIGAALTTGGWLAVAIGLLLGPHVSGVVQRDQLLTLQPLVLFCLGWVGLMVGLQAHRRLPQMLPGSTSRLALLDAGVSVVVFSAMALGVIWLLSDEFNWQWYEQLMVAPLLGACAIGWAPEVRSLRQVGTADTPLRGLLRGASGVGSILAAVCYGLVFAGAQLDHGADNVVVLLLIGGVMSVAIALVLGLMTWWLMRIAGRSDAEFLVVLLGTVTLMAGGAAVLGYSPLFVSLLGGAVLANMPGEVLTRFRRVIIDAEQPIAMVLMLVAGILADPMIGQTGAVLVVVLVVARMVFKRLITHRQVNAHAGPVQLNSPLRRAPMRQSPLAIALAAGYVMLMPPTDAVRYVDAGQLMMVVILVGLICDAVPWLSSVAIKALREDANPAGGDA